MKHDIVLIEIIGSIFAVNGAIGDLRNGKLPAVLSAVASDLLTATGSALAGVGGAVVGIAIGDLLEKRTRSARKILIEELKRGEKTIHDTSEVE